MPELKRYELDRDVQMRLDGTYIRYKGKPFYCLAAGDMRVQLFEINGDRLVDSLRISANDPELDISSVPLGYCNADGGPIYLTREAARRQKQGVSLQNINGYSETRRLWMRPVQRGMKIGHHRMKAMIEGKYPTLEEIMAHPKGQERGSAFHRRLCIIPFGDDGKWKLKYITQFAGILKPDMSVRLINDHINNSQLRSLLEQKGVQVNAW